MPVDLTSYKVANLELSSATKFDNYVQAVQDALNALPPAQITGYPADATKFLRGDGSWPSMPWIQLGDIDLSAVSTFSAISGVYRSLKIVWTARTPNAGTTLAFSVRFNGDSGANYDSNSLNGNNSVATSGPTVAATVADIGAIPAASATANRAGYGEVIIPMYAGTVFHKGYTSISSAMSTSAAANMWTQAFGGVWKSTAAITQIDLVASGGGALSAGSRAQLYGIL